MLRRAALIPLVMLASTQAVAAPLALLKQCAIASVVVPSTWTQTTAENITSYQSADGRRSLGVTVYELKPPFRSDAGRKKVLAKALQLSNSLAEKYKADKQRSKSLTTYTENIHLAQLDSYLPNTDQFIRQVTVAAGNCLQTFSYTVLGSNPNTDIGLPRVDIPTRTLRFGLGNRLTERAASAQLLPQPVPVPATGFHLPAF